MSRQPSPGDRLALIEQMIAAWIGGLSVRAQEAIGRNDTAALAGRFSAALEIVLFHEPYGHAPWSMTQAQYEQWRAMQQTMDLEVLGALRDLERVVWGTEISFDLSPPREVAKSLYEAIACIKDQKRKIHALDGS